MKAIPIIILIATSFLKAESEIEFRDRVSTAWNSKSSNEIIKLYKGIDNLDPTLKKQITDNIEFSLKQGFSNAEVSLVAPIKGIQKPLFMNKQMFYRDSEVAGQISIKLDKSKQVVSYEKNSDGTYSFSLPKSKKIEWDGEEMGTFQIIIRPEKAGDYLPESVVILERYGKADFELMNGSYSFRAHKIESIVIPSTPDIGSLLVEVSQGMENIIFKKVVDTSKGAIIPVNINTKK